MDDSTTSIIREMQDALAPARGLVLSENYRGVPFDTTTINKWIRLSGRVYRMEKVDLAISETGLDCLAEVLEFSHNEGMALSLRVKTPDLLEQVSAGTAAALHDILFAPDSLDIAGLMRCVKYCESVILPLRVQITAPFDMSQDISALMDCLMGAASVNVAVSSPFKTASPCATLEDCNKQTTWMNTLVTALTARGIEANLIGLPFCYAHECNYPNVMNSRQLFLDHQHYARPSYELAERAWTMSPWRLSMLLENLLARRNTFFFKVNDAVFPWILDHPVIHARAWMIYKFVRAYSMFRRQQQEQKSKAVYDKLFAIEESRQKKIAMTECGSCIMRRICDKESAAFQSQFPFLHAKAIKGESVIASPWHFAMGRKRCYDAFDAARLEMPRYVEELAETARKITSQMTPTREIPLQSYEIDGYYNTPDDASRRWFALSTDELCSTVLARVKTPFTISLTFGGGIAEHIGFRLGRHVRIVCPMIDYSHKLTLHVDGQGRYVLLRDGAVVDPGRTDRNCRLPVRLSDVLEPRISVFNIDGFLLTQTVLLWEGEPASVKPKTRIKYSIIIVSTCYARRLQAVLLSLAHQRGVDMSTVEVIIAYVPGIDATDDLIESMAATHPHLNIVRSCFPEDNVRSKGFMINVSAGLASGEWIILMDADIILPPDILNAVEAASATSHFIAPDGRRMLTPETTAKILLGEVKPWEEYNTLANEAAEYRYREGMEIPCGFFQCFKREILTRVPYNELDHFESSDWIFARDVIDIYGKETRLEGVDVLHLDHGGRQWYGTHKQR